MTVTKEGNNKAWSPVSPQITFLVTVPFTLPLIFHAAILKQNKAIRKVNCGFLASVKPQTYFNLVRKKEKTFVRNQKGEKRSPLIFWTDNLGNRENANKFSGYQKVADDVFATCSVHQNVMHQHYSLFRIIGNQNKCRRQQKNKCSCTLIKPFSYLEGMRVKKAECSKSTMCTSTCTIQ